MAKWTIWPATACCARQPAELVPRRLVGGVGAPALPRPAARDMHAVLADGDKAAIARYALGA